MKKYQKKIRSAESRFCAISQIILLIASIIAISYVIGSSVPLVSAQELCTRDRNNMEVKVGGWSQSQINQWCRDNGEREVCNYIGSDVWELRTSECIGAPLAPWEREGISVPQIPTKLFDKGLDFVSGGAGEEAAVVTENASIPPVTAAATGLKGFLGKSLGLGELTVGSLLKSIGWATAIYFGTRFVLGQLGVDPETARALSYAAAGGYFAGTMAAQTGLSATVGSAIGISTGLATFGIGFAIGAIIFFVTFKKTKYEVASFSCYPWDAQTGGDDCEKCNKGEFPCTEYKCKTLGQACELINKGTNEELCVWVNRGDVKPPVIQTWEEPLTIDYKYIPDNAVSPPDRGVKIVKEVTNGCVAPFTRLKFGITLDEPAKCKIDPLRQNSFEEMNFFFGGSATSKYNHSQQMSLPSPEALEAENITLQNGGQFEFYARCQDPNGNSNTANFVFKFCVDEGPDTTPPLIVTTSILNGMPIAYNQTSVDLQVYVNEPAECRWSKLDKSYDNMEEEMECNTNVLEFNAQMLYRCSTTLTGLKDRIDNNFYFRCKDQPHLSGTDRESDRNANSESYKFTLKGTMPLVIDSVEPNETTIKDATNIIKVNLEVQTSAGYNEGYAICYYNGFGTNNQFIEFYPETGTHRHSQELHLPEGDYTYDIKCIDLGGNSDTATISFSVESDAAAPIVVRVFREETDLKIITNENASCVYDNVDCSYLFEDGIEMSTSNDREHTVTWDSQKSFYIKCGDEFGNRPFPNACSIIARPFET